MNPKRWESPLCVACQSITLQMFQDGFEHPLKYPQIVEMGKTCKLCRLIVCSTSHLQTTTDRYQVNQDYDSWAAILPYLPCLVQDPAVAPRKNVPPIIVERVEAAPSRVIWRRYGAELGDHINGDFNGGNVIQISAAKGSIYESRGFSTAEQTVDLGDCGVASREIEPADSIRNQSLLYIWLRKCVEEHSRCRRSFSGEKFELDEYMDENQPLPTRLVEISPHTKRIRLVSTAGQKGTYIALSHRWGARRSLRTLKQNLADHLIEINAENLSKTFKDALEVTHNLGARYLWIDSLCIVQDDSDDWSFEATQMGKIFERAYCTIAAVDAIDDSTGTDGGLFLPREEDPLTVRLHCALQQDAVHSDLLQSKDGESYRSRHTYHPSPEDVYESAKEGLREQHRLIVKPRLLGSAREILDSKWNWRGWILQERILSRRMIYFSRTKLSWDCLTSSGEEESLGFDEPPPRATEFDDDIQCWQSLTEDYANCSLSFDSDKLAAISGLAERLGKRGNIRYFGGIFQDSEGRGLLWRSYSDEPMMRLVSFHAPSWTWAAYNGAIVYDICGDMDAGESTSDISRLAFNIAYDCPDTCPNKSTTCITGSVSWTGMIGTAVRSNTISSLNLSNDEDLINILGSRVHREPRPILRIVQGRLEETARKLSITGRAEVMKDEGGRNIGWVLFDTDVTVAKGSPFFCASIRRWRRVGRLNTSYGVVQGYDYMGEEFIDVLALKEREDRPWLYERIGIGRVVDKRWKRDCVLKKIEVW